MLSFYFWGWPSDRQATYTRKYWELHFGRNMKNLDAINGTWRTANLMKVRICFLFNFNYSIVMSTYQMFYLYCLHTLTIFYLYIRLGHFRILQFWGTLYMYFFNTCRLFQNFAIFSNSETSKFKVVLSSFPIRNFQKS